MWNPQKWTWWGFFLVGQLIIYFYGRKKKWKENVKSEQLLVSGRADDGQWTTFESIQPKTIDLSTRLLGITTEFVRFIPQSLVVRSIVLGWILIYRISLLLNYRHFHVSINQRMRALYNNIWYTTEKRYITSTLFSETSLWYLLCSCHGHLIYNKLRPTRLLRNSWQWSTVKIRMN